MFGPVRLLRLAVLLVVAWALLVYGLPVARGALPSLCERWQLSGGVCGEQAQADLARVDAWAQRVLAPLPRHEKVRRAVGDVREAFRKLEELARTQVGDERVNQALRGADIALQNLEGILGGTGSAKEKLADVPENAQVLLARVRDAFTRLRDVLGSTGRRAEEVSTAVEETKKALDALSGVLPKDGQ